MILLTIFSIAMKNKNFECGRVSRSASDDYLQQFKIAFGIFPLFLHEMVEQKLIMCLVFSKGQRKFITRTNVSRTNDYWVKYIEKVSFQKRKYHRLQFLSHYYHNFYDASLLARQLLLRNYRDCMQFKPCCLYQGFFLKSLVASLLCTNRCAQNQYPCKDSYKTELQKI